MLALPCENDYASLCNFDQEKVLKVKTCESVLYNSSCVRTGLETEIKGGGPPHPLDMAAARRALPSKTLLTLLHSHKHHFRTVFTYFRLSAIPDTRRSQLFLKLGHCVSCTPTINVATFFEITYKNIRCVCVGHVHSAKQRGVDTPKIVSKLVTRFPGRGSCLSTTRQRLMT